MKKIILTSLLTFILLIFLASFTFQSQPADKNKKTPDIAKVSDEFPEDIAKILKVHCMDCHVTASKNDKAKKKLNFDKWNELNMLKKTGKLNDIVEVVKEGEMPPEKYLNHYPDKKLSDEQIKTLVKWAEQTMDSFKE
jgi:mono/diheme cytochrome c family protein